jgi:hypothetical protein
MATLSDMCMAKYGMKGACPDGSCAVDQSECKDSQNLQMECPMQ